MLKTVMGTFETVTDFMRKGVKSLERAVEFRMAECGKCEGKRTQARL